MAMLSSRNAPIPPPPWDAQRYAREWAKEQAQGNSNKVANWVAQLGYEKQAAIAVALERHIEYVLGIREKPANYDRLAGIEGLNVPPKPRMLLDT